MPAVLDILIPASGTPGAATGRLVGRDVHSSTLPEGAAAGAAAIPIDASAS